MPGGTDRIAHWAARNGFAWRPVPEQEWFHAWEPYDTMVSPPRYINSVPRQYRRGAITFVEPWMGDEDTEPIDRTWMAFACHPRLIRKASARVGESFLTRVAFIETPPPPKVLLGDKEWDEWAMTFAVQQSEAQAAFRPQVRQVLRAWKFQGHVELRPGGLILQVAGMGPTPENLEHLAKFAPAVLDAALEERP